MLTATKRDTHAIWFKHVPAELSRQFERLEPNQTIDLAINDQMTTWARMKESPRGPTRGLRLENGRPVWECIRMGDTFTIGSVVPVRASNDAIAAALLPRHRRSSKPMFDGYEFADFSGARDTAVQRRTIRMAFARGGEKPDSVKRSLTRETLQAETLRRLEAATKRRERLAFGRDHQFSIPVGLAKEIGLDGVTWREALDSLVRGTYGGPPLAHASEFSRKFNDWLISRARRPYFFSCTKSGAYGVPRQDPRPSRFGMPDGTTYRLTELCQGFQKGRAPKPLNRIGDNGTVGGQTIVGLILLHEFLNAAQRRAIPVAVWPFDGLDIDSKAYQGRHVMFEAYPSSIRDRGVEQTDLNDAFACVVFVRGADRVGKLRALLDLLGLTKEQQLRALFEGWIVGHRP